MKEPFELNSEFHEQFYKTLDNIENGKIVRHANFKKFASIAAGLVFVLTAALLSAQAAGIIDINLNNTFKRIFNIENDEKAQQIAENLSAAALPECTSDGVTVKVIQAVNDNNNCTILFEVTSFERNLNRMMALGQTNIKIDGKPFESGWFNSSVITVEELSHKQTIEEFKNQYQEIPPPADEQQMLKETIDEYNNSFTNRLYFMLSFGIPNNVNGRNITIDIDGIVGRKDKIDPEKCKSFSDYSKSVKEVDTTAIEGNWNLSWTLADSAVSKTYNINKTYNDIYFNTITLAPMSMDMSYSMGEVYANNEDFDMAVYFHGVRYKDGSTHAIHSAGTTDRNKQTAQFYKTILDVDQVASIFIGENYTEIPLE